MNQPPQQQQPPGAQSAMRPKPDCGEESYRGSGRLAGKATVITGGDSGIGRAVAIAYAREGADVLISYLNEDADAKDTRGQGRARPRRHITAPALPRHHRESRRGVRPDRRPREQCGLPDDS